jgi:hypothetical protein
MKHLFIFHMKKTLTFLTTIAVLGCGGLPALADGVQCAGDAQPQVRLAAKEIRRFVFQRTGKLLPVGASVSGKVIALKVDATLEPQQYRLKTDGDTLTISGGSPVGVLYGAYDFVEKLGVRFYLHGDVIPDGKIPFALPKLDETHVPLFAVRGILPWHDFPEGPDWWNRNDWLSYVSQLAKMRMNFIGMHCYPNPEALVWVGVKSDCDEQGRVQSSPPSYWANTVKAGWDYTPTKTSDFAGGASLLFPEDGYGNEVQAGLMPLPKTPEECNEVFNRSAAMLRGIFSHAKELGVKTCIGTETPLTIPAPVKERLKSLGKDPADPAIVREVYAGIFTRVARACPVDYYWLWTPEVWTWRGNTPKQLEDTTRDIRAALDALTSIGKPFTLATAGWVVGPVTDRTAFDALIPKDSPMSSLNSRCGHEAVEPSFANLAGRPKWSIPWLENDPQIAQQQPWVGRMRYDAADSKRLGCTGLIGIHWRTKAMMQNVAALAAAGWDQSWVTANFDTQPVKPQVTGDGALGGTSEISKAPVENTEEPRIYQTVRCNTNGYNLFVPEGTYNITLKFNEPQFEAAGKRVFGVKIQGQPVIDGLDIFAKAGKNKALDYTFNNIEAVGGTLRIDFVRHVDFPCIVGIVIDGKTKEVNQIASASYTRKINCGGEKFQDYEADRVGGMTASAGRDRGMPITDFYADFASANFGEAVAKEVGAILESVDGVKMPRVTDWKGPVSTPPAAGAWEKVKKQFEFVEALAKLRPQVCGAGNLERFDYWLNSYRAMESIAYVGYMRGELDSAVAAMKNEKDPEKQKKLAADALDTRIRLARAWETLMSYQTAACDTPGEMGTIAHLEQRIRRSRQRLDLHDQDIAAALGAPLPAEASPSAHFSGAPRIIVPTVRTQIAPSESLQLNAIVLDNQPGQNVALFWRPMGKEKFSKIPFKHIGRAVYSATLPATAEDFEYYITAETTAGKKLVWPATAPEMNQTVVVTE